MACAGPGESPVSGPHDVPPGVLGAARRDPPLPAHAGLFLRRRLPLRTLVLGLCRRGGGPAWRARRRLAGGASALPLRPVGRPWLRPCSPCPGASCRDAFLLA